MAEKQEKKKRSVGEIAMWIIMALLIVGLGGFGIDGVLNGSITRVARVGDKDVDVNTYARALQNQMSQLSQQAGRAITFTELRENGVDRAILETLMRERALDFEAQEMGISIGDENLRDQILEIPAFQGIDGNFDREGYRFALENAGLSEGDFEAQLRDESARTILQGAVLGGVVMPDTYADTLVNYVGETRNFSWVRLDQSNLDENLDTPDDATLRAYYNDNIDDYQLPETKRITYAALEPNDLIDQVEIADDDLEAEYQARLGEFNQPERRLVERLVYLDEEAANAAAAQLDVGTTFETLVQDRGLSLGDVDLGDVGRLELDAAGEAVFNAEVGDVVGPLPSPLGPALFRVNGILPAQSRSFDEVKDLIRLSLAGDNARRLVAAQAQSFDDMLAGGATLEDLANETDMILGTIDWYPAIGTGIAAYDDFRAAAQILTEEDFPKIDSLSDGAIFAMRLDEVLSPRPNPFDDIKDNVLGNWEAERAERLLTERAEDLLPALEGGQSFEEAGLSATTEERLDRGAFLTGMPTDFMSEVFTMAEGDVKIVTGFGAVNIVRLESINPASENPDYERLRDSVSTETSNALARDIFSSFSDDAMLRAGREIDVRALEAVNANFQ